MWSDCAGRAALGWLCWLCLWGPFTTTCAAAVVRHFHYFQSNIYWYKAWCLGNYCFHVPRYRLRAIQIVISSELYDPIAQVRDSSSHTIHWWRCGNDRGSATTSPRCHATTPPLPTLLFRLYMVPLSQSQCLHCYFVTPSFIFVLWRDNGDIAACRILLNDYVRLHLIFRLRNQHYYL